MPRRRIVGDAAGKNADRFRHVAELDGHGVRESVVRQEFAPCRAVVAHDHQRFARLASRDRRLLRAFAHPVHTAPGHIQRIMDVAHFARCVRQGFEGQPFHMRRLTDELLVQDHVGHMRPGELPVRRPPGVEQGHAGAAGLRDEIPRTEDVGPEERVRMRGLVELLATVRPLDELRHGGSGERHQDVVHHRLGLVKASRAHAEQMAGALRAESVSFIGQPERYRCGGNT